jgi:hypothetical protein
MHRFAAMPDRATFQSDYRVNAKISRSEINVRIRRMAGLLVAGTLAAGPCATGAAAQAATATGARPAIAAVSPPQPNPFLAYEVFPPYIDPTALKCLDVPSAATQPVALQLFSCHGYASNGANQRWYFNSAGTYNGLPAYQIQNKNSHLCLEPDGWGPDYGPVFQDECRPSIDQYWEISSPNESDHVNLINVYGWCLAASDASGNNHTPVILSPCDPGPIWNQNQYTTWQLG